MVLTNFDKLKVGMFFKVIPSKYTKNRLGEDEGGVFIKTSNNTAAVLYKTYDANAFRGRKVYEVEPLIHQDNFKNDESHL